MFHTSSCTISTLFGSSSHPSIAQLLLTCLQYFLAWPVHLEHPHTHAVTPLHGAGCDISCFPLRCTFSPLLLHRTLPPLEHVAFHVCQLVWAGRQTGSGRHHEQTPYSPACCCGSPSLPFGSYAVAPPATLPIVGGTSHLILRFVHGDKPTSDLQNGGRPAWTWGVPLEHATSRLMNCKKLSWRYRCCFCARCTRGGDTDIHICMAPCHVQLTHTTCAFCLSCHIHGLHSCTLRICIPYLHHLFLHYIQVQQLAAFLSWFAG